MIHVVLGTKAQLIKMAPIMALMEQEGIPYNFILTGQHQETMDDLRANFGIKNPDYVLYNGGDITSIPRMLFWCLSIVVKSWFQKDKIFKRDQNGIVLVHGDTFSTLLGALIGKLNGLKVGHVESGLRSFNVLHPFPEELTRLAVFKLSDIYFCPGEWPISNLTKYKGIKVNTCFNTLLDSLAVINSLIEDKASVVIPSRPYCIVTTHRFENWVSREIALLNISLIELVAQKIQCVFILHPITAKKLETFGLSKRLENNINIELRKRYDYLNFIQLIKKSEFVVSDGGSNQEECFYLGKPCLLLRKASERQEGIGQNIVISDYSKDVVVEFVDKYKTYRREHRFESESPSRLILSFLKQQGYVNS